MRTAATIMLVLTLTLAGACRDRSEVAQTAPDDAVQTAATLTPAQLGTIGAEVRKEPAKAEEILARHGLDKVSFEKAVRDVTESPEASKQYAEAFRKASA